MTDIKQPVVCLNDREAIKRLNLVAAVLERDPSELLVDATNLLWEKHQSKVLSEIDTISHDAPPVERPLIRSWSEINPEDNGIEKSV